MTLLDSGSNLRPCGMLKKTQQKLLHAFLQRCMLKFWNTWFVINKCTFTHTFIYAALVLHMSLNVLWEPLIELLVGIKQGWHDKMQQRPQLTKKHKHGTTESHIIVSLYSCVLPNTIPYTAELSLHFPSFWGVPLAWCFELEFQSTTGDFYNWSLATSSIVHCAKEKFSL